MSYNQATRHPWPCLVFVLPMLAAYETGVLELGGTNPDAVRNGADYWLRMAFGSLGLPLWVPPLVLLTALVGWAYYRREDQPDDLIGTLSGMAVESVLYAVGLWLLSNSLEALLRQHGVANALEGATAANVRQVVTYLGAGIYEEAIFRLALFSGLLLLLRVLETPLVLASLLAALVSALLFSAAHHLGPYGQPYSNFLFLFRLLAGVYFAVLFQLRGYGIVVGAHAIYNVMVSVTAPETAAAS
jgi:membrane protease YdiL (CAAX protease family)